MSNPIAALKSEAGRGNVCSFADRVKDRASRPLIRFVNSGDKGGRDCRDCRDGAARMQELRFAGRRDRRVGDMATFREALTRRDLAAKQRTESPQADPQPA